MTAESKIWVIMEIRQGRLAEVGLEILGRVLTLPRPTGWGVAAVLIGHDLQVAADEAVAYGADEALVLSDPLLADYCNTAWVKALEPHIRSRGPEVILLGATAQGTDLAPRLAARLRTGLSAHCIDFELTAEGGLLAVVPGWGGSLNAKISCPTARPQMATVMPGVFTLPEKTTNISPMVYLPVEVGPADLTYKIVSVERQEVRTEGLETADIVVAGGWGVGGPEGWKLIEKLAEVLGGAVGSTRPPVDEGWAAEGQMVGTSGRSIKPKLYIGVALSGHSHHMVGVKECDLAVGINSDTAAAIFRNCDIGLVGDYKAILPALIKELSHD